MIRTEKAWVPWLKVILPLAAGTAGMAIWIALKSWWGAAIFVAFFLVGSVVGRLLFKRLASERQIRDDLEARLHND